MRPTALELPARASKPRTKGHTMMVDGGLPTRQFQDIVQSSAEYLDFVKFGWGTALVTKDLQRKIDALDDAGVDYYFGGTLFEKFVLQDRFDDFRDLCQRYSCRYVEVSNGTISLSGMEKVGYITKLADDFCVISEVGFKDAERSERLAPARWIESVHDDLDAGALLVTLEARESGRSGICRPNGELRFGLIEEILDERPSGGPPPLRGSLDGAAVLLRHAGGHRRQSRQHPLHRDPRPRDDSSRPPLRHLGGLRGEGLVRESRDVFHLAIPVYDLDESQEFYVGALGCKLARRYADRITIDFFGDQLVCHLVDPPERCRPS